MKSERHSLPWLGPWAMALTLLLANHALAQTAMPRVAVAPAEDMRLWSFGDCDRRFPYVNTDEHKECVRVVGSPEARDARALRVCEVSHAMDREEVDRCKSAYRSNKEKAAEDGVLSNAPPGAHAPPSEELMRRVKVITAAAIEAERAAAPAALPPAGEAEPQTPLLEPESSPVTKIGLALLAAVILGYRITIMRRKHAQSA